MATQPTAFRPDYAIPPGEILEETLEARGLTKAEFAERCGRPAKTISEIIAGKAAITPETAIQFERVLGVAARLWTNLEVQYRLRLAESAESEKLASHQEWAKRFPIAAMAKFGLIRLPSDAGLLVKELLDFLGIGGVEAWSKRFEQYATSYRGSLSFKSAPESLAAWLRWGDQIAETADAAPFDAERFRAALVEIRSLTRDQVDAWRPRLVELCRTCGVIVVFVPELPKTHISGAARWVSKDRALIQLSLRHKTDDHLWFTFFHEAAHILLHGKRDVFIDEGMDGPVDDVKENEADRFASDHLIPAAAWRQFVASGRFSPRAVWGFARAQGIAPGIVVGRLQRDKLIPFNRLNVLKQRYEWTSE